MSLLDKLECEKLFLEGLVYYIIPNGQAMGTEQRIKMLDKQIKELSI